MSRPSNIVLVNENYQKLADCFLHYQKRLGYQSKSNRGRFNSLREFLHWLEASGKLEITVITAKEISLYYSYISHRPNKKDGGTLSQKTTHSHMRTVRDLFEMLQSENSINHNPCSTLKFPYPKSTEERTVVSQQEIGQLYEVCQTAQERAILSLIYGCGLRVGEAVDCNIEDIKLREKILIVPKGKGNKRRVVPMSSGVAKDLSDYYYNQREALADGRDYKPDNPEVSSAFMLNARGGRMQDGTYNRNLKILIERTNNKELEQKQVTIHSLRHSIATHLLEQGIAVEQVRLFLGHSQLETTQIYTHISQGQIKRLMY